MEEQPIDKLFRRRLHEAEIAPSKTAWATLQAKRAQKHIVPIWSYVAVAASLLLVGSFGWWTLRTQGKTNTIATVTKDVEPRADLSLPQRKESGIVLTNPQKLELAHTDTKRPEQIDLRIPRVEREGRSQVKLLVNSHKAKSVITPEHDFIASGDHIQESKPNMVPEIVESIKVLTEAKTLVIESLQPTLERTLIVTINVPTSSLPTTATVRPTAIGDRMTDTVVHKSGFSNLLKNVRRLKEGDILALGSTETSKTNRKGLSKLYGDVKESIKNNSTE